MSKHGQKNRGFENSLVQKKARTVPGHGTVPRSQVVARHANTTSVGTGGKVTGYGKEAAPQSPANKRLLLQEAGNAAINKTLQKNMNPSFDLTDAQGAALQQARSKAY